jgi:peptidoglycan/LPS O-acetylase OafA/YrhL
MRRKIKRPLNPFWLMIISVFLSFVVAGLVAAFNYGRMGKQELKKKTIKCTLLGFIAFCIVGTFLSFLIPDLFPVKPNFPSIGTVINVMVAAFLIHKQLPVYTEWKLKINFDQEV